MKEEFVLKKGKVYLLSREEREEVYEYIRLSKSLQVALVFL